MGIEITVRRAAAADIPALAEIEKICFSEPWSEKVFAEFMPRDNAVTLAAEADGAVCGFITGTAVSETADIYDIGVLPDFRRNGVGTALLREFLAVLPINTETANLEVRESNKNAISLYEKFGFVRVGMRKNFYSDPREDAVLMTKFLK